MITFFRFRFHPSSSSTMTSTTSSSSSLLYREKGKEWISAKYKFDCCKNCMHAFLSSHSYHAMPCNPEAWVCEFFYWSSSSAHHDSTRQGAEMQSTKFYMRIHHENQKLFDVGGDDCDVSCDKEAPGWRLQFHNCYTRPSSQSVFCTDDFACCLAIHSLMMSFCWKFELNTYPHMKNHNKSKVEKFTWTLVKLTFMQVYLHVARSMWLGLANWVLYHLSTDWSKWAGV